MMISLIHYNIRSWKDDSAMVTYQSTDDLESCREAIAHAWNELYDWKNASNQANNTMMPFLFYNGDDHVLNLWMNWSWSDKNSDLVINAINNNLKKYERSKPYEDQLVFTNNMGLRWHVSPESVRIPGQGSGWI